MHDTGEMWSLPWHALQRNLAEGIGGVLLPHSGATVRAVSAQGAVLSTNSWLGRARLRVTELQNQMRP
jgi:hypothetical protein